jgi:DNA-binding NarL/FixJ family response regulator
MIQQIQLDSVYVIGASGYWLKHWREPQQEQKPVQQPAERLSVYVIGASGYWLKHWREPQQEPECNAIARLGLKPRQAEICKLMLESLSIKEMAERLHLKPRGVKQRLSRLYKDFGITSGCRRVRLVHALLN